MEELAKSLDDAGHDVPVDRPDAGRNRIQRQGAHHLRPGILVVYLTLSAQYESFALPFIILLAVPMAVLGALGLVSLRGLSNDVYCQIGLVMLIGLSAKNSILIVEFAEQLRRKDRSIAEAAIEAAELRLRPILMTSFAFILGVLPLVFATGAGALGRRSVGTTIVGGMLLSTVLNLFFIPVLYVILSRLLIAAVLSL
jgi:HAE1 family hydrophobic/amphiphilic exporter-1